MNPSSHCVGNPACAERVPLPHPVRNGVCVDDFESTAAPGCHPVAKPPHNTTFQRLPAAGSGLTAGLHKTLQVGIDGSDVQDFENLADLVGNITNVILIHRHTPKRIEQRAAMTADCNCPVDRLESSVLRKKNNTKMIAKLHTNA